jgi:hypothetical protein
MATLDGKQLKNGTVTSAKVDSTVLTTDGARALSSGVITVSGTGDIILPTTPLTATSAVNKTYVDAVASGLDPKASVSAVTAAALPAYTRVGNVITADAAGALPAIDGVTLDVTNKKRLLLKNGAAGADNGIYEVTTLGDGGTAFVLTRAPDANSDAEVTSGMYTFAVEGTANGLKGWVLVTPDPITLNTTSLSFSQLSQAAAAAWGSITGTLSNQTDLQTALDGKVDENAAITAGTNTKITYDAKGLVTAGSAATTADIADSTNARYVTDAQLVVIGNTSGTNSGDVTVGTTTTAQANGASISSQVLHLSVADATNPGLMVAADFSKLAAITGTNTGDQALATGMRHLTASVTTTDFDQAMTTTVSATNTHGGEVAVFVNGMKQWVGSGNKTSDCYFSGDAGTTARTFAAIASGDTLHWVGSVAGYQLAASDVVDVMFMP